MCRLSSLYSCVMEQQFCRVRFSVHLNLTSIDKFIQAFRCVGTPFDPCSIYSYFLIGSMVVNAVFTVTNQGPDEQLGIP